MPIRAILLTPYPSLPTHAPLLVYGESLLIGRAEPAEIVVPDPSVSNRHARLTWQEADQSYIVTDLNSVNGLFVNGKEVIQATLRVGDVLQVGESTFRVDRSPIEVPGHCNLPFEYKQQQKRRLPETLRIALTIAVVAGLCVAAYSRFHAEKPRQEGLVTANIRPANPPWKFVLKPSVKKELDDIRPPFSPADVRNRVHALILQTERSISDLRDSHAAAYPLIALTDQLLPTRDEKGVLKQPEIHRSLMGSDEATVELLLWIRLTARDCFDEQYQRLRKGVSSGREKEKLSAEAMQLIPPEARIEENKSLLLDVELAPLPPEGTR